MEVPPPFTNLQASRGAKRRLTAWQEEPGGGRRSAGALGLIFDFAFIRGVCFQSLVSQGMVGPAHVPAFGRDEWEETICRK